MDDYSTDIKYSKLNLYHNLFKKIYIAYKEFNYYGKKRNIKYKNGT